MTPMRSLLRWLSGVAFALLITVSSYAVAGEVQAVKQLDTSAILGNWTVVKYWTKFGFFGKLFSSLPDPKECKKANVKYESVDAGFTVTFSCLEPVPGKSPASEEPCQVKPSTDPNFPGKLTWYFLRADRPHWVLMQTDRYLVIGGPKRWSLMILSRDGQLTAEEEAAINGKLGEQGYDPSKLVAFGS